MAYGHGDCELCFPPCNRKTNCHHLAYPKAKYRTSLEKAYRSLKCMKLQICLPRHKEIHAENPDPPKPSAKEMRKAIEDHKKKECFCKTPRDYKTNMFHRHRR